MYDVIYKDEQWWITYDDKIIEELGGFIDPVSPLRIIKEIQDEI